MTHRLVRVPRWDLYLLLLVIPEQRRGHLRDDLYFRPHACSLSYGPVGALVRWPLLGVSCHAAVIGRCAVVDRPRRADPVVCRADPVFRDTGPTP